MTATVLVIDDEKNIRRTLRMVLEGEGYEVDEAESAELGLERVGFGPDLVILDVRLPRMSGLEALTRIRETNPQLPVLMISGHASVAEAVQAVQSGATDFFEKPLDRDRVLVRVKNALEKRALEQEVRRLRADAERRYEMIGESAVMKALYRDIEKVAPTRGRVLITGESGTGKELIARALHRLSPRHDAPFVKVNCAAIPGELIESELFGYERGAFTGAQARRKGMFELADGGTLFLDEIGDMSLNAQAKVLRALQSGEITRVGSEKSIAVDVRVVAATNKDLEKAITDGEFREDLFFRLNVVPLRSPGLRERRDDIPALAAAFLRDFCAENGLKDKPIGPEVLERLQQKAWPGNVRELRNVVERMAILSGDVIEVEDLPADGKLARAAARESGDATPDPIHDDDGRRLTLREYRDRAERRYLVSTLEECEWNVSKAASMLGVERTNLHKKMRSLGVQRDEP
ncbi:MAG: sigma-54-dependent Fis family transcriptional regulator [Sandaracinaceae bacterium]|nr:MAG: sigma-54-dependent Fis family transcriptional regulator [Sandaracinaceae bacterium]